MSVIELIDAALLVCKKHDEGTLASPGDSLAIERLRVLAEKLRKRYEGD